MSDISIDYNALLNNVFSLADPTAHIKSAIVNFPVEIDSIEDVTTIIKFMSAKLTIKAPNFRDNPRNLFFLRENFNIILYNLKNIDSVLLEDSDDYI